jgi:magnesium-transporting ATPase (P-type)
MISIDDIEKFNSDQDAALNLGVLQELGGLEAVAKQLKTDLRGGLQGDKDDLEWRAKTYGMNMVPQPPTKTWFFLFFETFEDQTVIILIVSAIVSLIVGLYESLTSGWIEGTAILAAVLIVAVVTACNNYVKEVNEVVVLCIAKCHDPTQQHPVTIYQITIFQLIRFTPLLRFGLYNLENGG